MSGIGAVPAAIVGVAIGAAFPAVAGALVHSLIRRRRDRSLTRRSWGAVFPAGVAGKPEEGSYHDT